MSFFRRLEERARSIDSLLCVGLDPRCAVGEIVEQNRRVIEATADLALCFKPNSAFYEQHGPAGLTALEETLALIPDEVPVLLDAKRGDIGPTGEAYAAACRHYGVDAVTVSPYMGEDSVRPFVDAGLAVFSLCRTSNPGSAEFQLPDLGELVARTAAGWQGEVGLVVAGNDAAALRTIRSARPDAWFLAPGIGAQGGSVAEAVEVGLRKDGLGMLLAVSRAVAAADDPGRAARKLVDQYREARDARGGAGGNDDAGVADSGPGIATGDAPARVETTPIRPAVRNALLDAILDTGCFRVGEFTLKSGASSPFYIDLRRLQSSPAALEAAAAAYESLLALAGRPDRIAAVPVAAISLATALALGARLPLIYPRLPPKPHGTGNRIEGEWHPGERVLLVDDLVTTGKSKIEAAAVLREEGLVVEDLVVLIQRARTNPDLDKAGLRVHAAARIEDLVTRAAQRRIISGDDERLVLDYLDATAGGGA